MRFPGWPSVLLISAITLAGITGFFVASAALGQEPVAPTKTVTVEVSGEPGPPGPPGPAGPQGPQGPAGLDCITGYSPGILVLIQQGKGPTRLYGCLED